VAGERQAQPKPNSTLVDWLDSLIVPGGLLLVAVWNPNFSFMDGVGNN
jgi:hypothetical protein